jgi:hypothetical protein
LIRPLPSVKIMQKDRFRGLGMLRRATIRLLVALVGFSTSPSSFAEPLHGVAARKKVYLLRGFTNVLSVDQLAEESQKKY